MGYIKKKMVFKTQNNNQRALDDQSLSHLLTTSTYLQMYDAEKLLDTTWDNLFRIEEGIKECILKLATWTSTQGYSKYNAIRAQVALTLKNNDAFCKNAIHNQQPVLSTFTNPVSI